MSTVLDQPSSSAPQEPREDVAQPSVPAPQEPKQDVAQPSVPAFTSVNQRTSMSPVVEQSSPLTCSAASIRSPVLAVEEEEEEEEKDCPSPEPPMLSLDQPFPPRMPVSRKRRKGILDSLKRRDHALVAPGTDRHWTIRPGGASSESEEEAQRQQAQRREAQTAAAAHAMNDSHDSEEPDAARARVHHELKKRKRQFANRTKTGCGTCRRRKKKCDEAKPDCHNCQRGGFLCEGYANKMSWPKSAFPKPPPPPLQAKEQTVEAGPAHAKRSSATPLHAPHCELGQQPIKADENQGKPPAPANWTDGRPQPQSTSLPPLPPRASEPPQPSGRYTSPPSPPSHDLASLVSVSVPYRQHVPRVYHHTPQTMSQVGATPSAPNAYPVHSHPTVSAPPESVSRQLVMPRPRQSHSLPSTVSLAAAPSAPVLNHHHHLQQSLVSMSEKDKMLAGEPFLVFDGQLVDERQHCAGAVHQFNSTSNAAVSIASEERARLFKTIVAARWVPPRASQHPVLGHLGGNVRVATPFTCEYGYNLSIAENVAIGPNCQLLDSARICIGRNTRIGARVTMQTLKTPSDPTALKGSNGAEIAQQIWIGENVYIGDGVIIESGVKIGDHAIVRAGSVVVRDLPSKCVAHGNPAFG